MGFSFLFDIFFFFIIVNVKYELHLNAIYVSMSYTDRFTLFKLIYNGKQNCGSIVFELEFVSWSDISSVSTETQTPTPFAGGSVNESPRFIFKIFLKA